MTDKKYKYRINELLNNLPLFVNRKALKVIPKELNVSVATFTNYRNIQIGDNQDIPHEKVCVLEKIFSLQPNELQNFTVDAKPLSSIVLDADEGSIVTKYQLQKS